MKKEQDINFFEGNEVPNEEYKLKRGRKKKEILKTVSEIQEELISNFALVKQNGAAEDVLSYIIEMGKTLEPMPEELKTDSSLVYGCMSKVWISFVRNHKTGVRDKRVVNYVGDADSAITKGIVAILFKIFNKQKYDAIIQSELFLIDKLGFISMLGHQRAFGLANIIKHVKMIALLEKTRPRRGRKPKDA